MDGFPTSLVHLAHLFAETTRNLQCVTAVSKNKWHCGVGAVIDAIAAHGNLQWFKDQSTNAEWVSYSAIYNPKTAHLTVYEGHFEHQIAAYIVPLRTAATDNNHGKRIAKLYREAQREGRMTPEQRAERERQVKEKAQRARKRALAKLTPTDRVTLGV